MPKLIPLKKLKAKKNATPKAKSTKLVKKSIKQLIDSLNSISTIDQPSLQTREIYWIVMMVQDLIELIEHIEHIEHIDLLNASPTFRKSRTKAVLREFLNNIETGTIDALDLLKNGLLSI